MKKLLLLLFATIFISSCSIKEEVYINNDKSINYGFNIGMDNLKGFLLSRNQDSLKLPIDTIMTLKEFSESDLLGKSRKKVDSDEKEMLEVFKDFKVHFKLSESNGTFRFFTKQKNINKLNKVMDNLSQKLTEKAQKEDTDKDSEFFSEIISTPRFSFKGNTFTRKENRDLTKLKEELENDKNDLLGMTSMLKYQLEYHFPRPVKNISDTTVLMSWDRKTIYMEKSINDLFNDKNTLNFEVELED